MRFQDTYRALATPETNGRKIGRFRTLCAIFGGLLVAYTGMTLLVFLIPSTVGRAMILPFLFTTFVWSCTALWISLSPTRLSALRRSLIPSVLFTLGIVAFILMA